MNILDRHLLRSVLGTSAAAVCLFAFLLIARTILTELLAPVLSGQLPLFTFGRLVVLALPVVITYALPLGMLTGILLTLGRLSSDSEITAMRSVGLSVPRIAAPALGLAFVAMLLGLRINFESMPSAKIEYERVFSAAIRANPLNFIQPRTFIREFPGCVIYVGSMKGADVKDFWLWKLDDEKRVVQFVRAQSGRVDYDGERNEFVVTLQQAQVVDFDHKHPERFDEALKISTAEQIEPFRISMARYFGVQTVHQKLQWMTLGELRAERARLEAEKVPADGAEKHDRAILQVDLTVQDKINTALAIFTFALVGVPLGIKVSRRETSANLGIAVVLALSYYLVIVAVGMLDHHPELHPEILLWLPNLVLFCLGICLLRRLDRA